MLIGIPSEIKDNEKLVSLRPGAAAELVHHGHEVLVQSGAGEGSRFSDEEFAAAGARIVARADEVFAAADLIVKVKEPVPAEHHRFRGGQQLFTFLHATADRSLTDFLLERNIDWIAYETVQETNNPAATCTTQWATLWPGVPQPAAMVNYVYPGGRGLFVVSAVPAVLDTEPGQACASIGAGIPG